jgi:Zn-finger nucleic acid-binding protein
MNLKCPRCLNSELIGKDFRSSHFYQCQDCCGIWISSSNLFKLSGDFESGDNFLNEHVNKQLESKSNHPAKNLCPVDELNLETYEIPCVDEQQRTVLDHCSKCLNVWIDGNELGSVRETVLINRKSNAISEIRVKSNSATWALREAILRLFIGPPKSRRALSQIYKKMKPGGR